MEQRLKYICFFGFLGYIRKAGQWYFKPYDKDLHHFGEQKAITYRNSDLNALVDAVTNILVGPVVVG